jgi:predicted transposase YbfD/YdcC
MSMTEVEAATASIKTHFGHIQDPRVDYLVIHPFINIMTIALCAIIAGADSWADVARFGQSKQNWLETFLDLESGIPSHDTFSTLFARLNPDQLKSGFISWVQTIHHRISGEVVAVDGKKLRHSFDNASKEPMITMVSAWASDAQLVLGQEKVANGHNEIPAIKELLPMLEIAGCIVTIDAIGCQQDIAAQIIEQEADYLLAVKGNQENLQDDIALFFELAEQTDFSRVNHTYARKVNKGHGRVEVRQCWAIDGEESLQFLRNYQAWSGLKTIIRIESERHMGDEVSVTTSYFISSLPNDADRILAAKRAHWGIENRLHWVLDIAFREDDARNRVGHSAENMAILRHMAVNLLKQEKTGKGGIKAKRLQAAWDNNYLAKVLSGSMR